jgi:hypothetical protein
MQSLPTPEVLILIFSSCSSAKGLAHCDTLDGPVVSVWQRGIGALLDRLTEPT